jgi:diguanylate cyclase (GGDEF)-like protein
MNPMSTLVLQLLLYAATWLVLAGTFKLNRQASLWWAAAFGLLAMGAFIDDAGLRDHQIVLSTLVNLGIVGGFYCLMRGMAYMARDPLIRVDTLAPLALLVMLLGIRIFAPEAFALRMLLFGLAASVPLGRSVWLLKRLLSDTGYPKLFVPLGLIPILGFIALLAARPIGAMLDPAGLTGYMMDETSGFKILFIYHSFIFLALFNLAMAVVVIGGLIKHLHQLSQTDHLTRLPNRRSVLASVSREHGLYRRSGHAYSVLVIDIDFFKRVNDTHGHAVGDEVLVGVAQTMKACARATDVVARFGGEEFLVFLPNSDEDQAYAMAERMRLAVMTGNHASVTPPLAVTISLGISTVAAHDATIDEVIARADRALYQAKHCGRNQVVRPSALTDSIWSESLDNAT